MLHVTLLFMNRLSETEAAIFFCFQRIPFLQNYSAKFYVSQTLGFFFTIFTCYWDIFTPYHTFTYILT